MKNGLFSPCKGLSISDIIGRKENGTNATYFKFTTLAGDYERYNVWLNVPTSANKYGGKFFAFFGSKEIYGAWSDVKSVKVK